MTKIEKAVKLLGTQIKSLHSGYDRVYIGSEATGDMLIHWKKYTALARDFLRSGKGVSYVTPYLTLSREKELDALFRELERLACDYEGLELIANDYGTIMLTRGYSIDISLGRLLCRQDSDPRIPSFFNPQMQKANYTEGKADVPIRPSQPTLPPGRIGTLKLPSVYSNPPDNMAKHLTTQSISKTAIDFLKNINNRIIRIETDNLLQGVAFDRDLGLPVSLHVKGILVAVKHCEDSAADGGKIYYDDPSITVNLYKRGNCLCYDNLTVSREFGFDRIVE